jgi:hypothetical protein
MERLLYAQCRCVTVDADAWQPRRLLRIPGLPIEIIYVQFSLCSAMPLLIAFPSLQICPTPTPARTAKGSS